jgi:hypothetical protein
MRENAAGFDGFARVQSALRANGVDTPSLTAERSA